MIITLFWCLLIANLFFFFGVWIGSKSMLHRLLTNNSSEDQEIIEQFIVNKAERNKARMENRI
jgi:hypothetical protein